MAQALLNKNDGLARLAITVDMLDAMVASGTIDEPSQVELIEGELVFMSPTHVPHARLTSRLIRQLGNMTSDEYEVFDGVSLRINDYNEPMPDICIARAGVEKNVLAPADCVLVIEVSDATAIKDRVVKAPLYAKAGIPEFWIVDLTTSETIVHIGGTASGWTSVIVVPFTQELAVTFDDAIKVTVSEL